MSLNSEGKEKNKCQKSPPATSAIVGDEVHRGESRGKTVQCGKFKIK